MEYSPIECFLKHFSLKKHIRKERLQLSKDDIEKIKCDNIDTIVSMGENLMEEGLVLPECVKSVYFEGKKLNGLPSTLENLILGDDCECDFANLPMNLKVLVMWNCDEPLDFLPIGLKSLIIEGKLNVDLLNLPPTLENLVIKDEHETNVILPESLILLDSCRHFDCDFPKNLKILGIGNDRMSANMGLGWEAEIQEIPDTVEELSMCSMRYISLKNIPEQLKKLSLGLKFDSGNVEGDEEDFNEMFDIDENEFEKYDFSPYQHIFENLNEQKVIFWIINKFGSVPKNLTKIETYTVL